MSELMFCVLPIAIVAMTGYVNASILLEDFSLRKKILNFLQIFNISLYERFGNFLTPCYMADAFFTSLNYARLIGKMRKQHASMFVRLRPQTRASTVTKNGAVVRANWRAEFGERATQTARSMPLSY